MAEEQLAELQSRFDCERNTNKQLESKKTELARESVCLSVCMALFVYMGMLVFLSVHPSA